MSGLTVGVFNDSFPPTIDGVANATFNYASVIHKNHGTAIVATPWYPGVKDDYPFEVIRYPSAYVNKKLGYRAGYPFSPYTVYRLRKAKFDIIHAHSPFISAVLARVIRYRSNIPIVFTYHTKFDIEFERIVPFNHVRSASAKFLLSNINACDEVWVVSKGAGENLRSLGYTGDYLIMENGTDFPKGRASRDETEKLRLHYRINESTPVFLFVGRMMWYKGIRIILDGLKKVKANGQDFKMIFVGDGYDCPEIKEYADECKLQDDCIFTGAIYDRDILRTYYSMANLFLFPSTFDTNGIAVTEAAACSLPSLLIEGSCAAERVKHMESGILINEDAEELADSVLFACKNPMLIKKMGEAAAEKIYISWEDAVARAYERYNVILENYVPRKDLPSRFIFYDEIKQLKEEFGIKKEHLIGYYREKEGKAVKDILDHLFK